MLWEQAAEWLAKPRKGLITDVDGVISPIVNTPDAAQVTITNQALLAELTKQLDLVAVISGRAAADVSGRVGVPNIVYVGNHGMERWHEGQAQIPSQVAHFRPQMQIILDALKPHETDGILLEDKGATLSLHYRNTEHPEATADSLRSILTPLIQAQGLRLYEGRMLFEIRPPLDMNKGTAFRDLITEYQLDAALYLGDDTTDVDALKAARNLREQGDCFAFGIGVTADETPQAVIDSADFCISGVSGVEAFFSALLSALKAS